MGAFWSKLAAWGRRRWRVLGLAVVGAVLAGAAGNVLPGQGVRWGVDKVLRGLGMADVSIHDADVRLFGGRVVLRRMLARPRTGAALGLDGLDLVMRWRPLFHRRLSVQTLALEGLNVDVRQDGGRMVVNGLPMEAGGGGGVWSFGADSVHIVASRVRFTEGSRTYTLDIDALDVVAVHSWAPAEPAHFHLTGRLDGAPVEIAGSATPFDSHPRFELSLAARQVDLARFATLSGLDVLKGEVGGSVSLSGSLPATGLRLEAQGEMAVRGLEVGDGDLRATTRDTALRIGRLVWNGDSLTVDGSATTAGLALQGGFGRGAADMLSLTLRDGRFDRRSRRLDGSGAVTADGLGATAAGLDFRGRHLSADGTFALEPDGAATTTLTAAAADGLAARDPAAGRDLGTAEHVDVADFRLAPGQPLAAARVEARGLAALPTGGSGRHPWLVEAAALRMDKATLPAGGGFVAGALAFDGLAVRLIRAPTGFLGLPQGDGAGGPQSPPPRLALGRLAIGGDSHLLFMDRTLDRRVRLDFGGVGLTLSNLDTARPDQDSPFELKARLGEASLSASGSARPFAGHPSGRVAAAVHAFELPPLSPYAADVLGVVVQTGHVDGHVELAMDGGSVDGKADMALSNLFVATPDADAAVNREARMPIATVLDLLRDGDDRIQLSVPFRGDISAPDFDVSDAVSQAVGGALRATAMTTLKLVFPVAALIELATEDDGLTLPPVPFLPGEEAPAGAERARLEAVAELLRQRPALHLSLCGVAVGAADWPVLLERRQSQSLGVLYKLQKMVHAEARPETTPPDPERLAALAARRAEAVKSILVGQGVEAGRLFSCRPDVDKGSPRVELRL